MKRTCLLEFETGRRAEAERRAQFVEGVVDGAAEGVADGVVVDVEPDVDAAASPPELVVLLDVDELLELDDPRLSVL
jgi:hypothetical protein